MLEKAFESPLDCKVAEVVHHFCCHVGYFRLHEVAVVAGGLSLEDIAIVDEDEVIAIGLSQLVDVSRYPGKCALKGFPVDKVVREKATMHVAGLDDA